MENATRNFDAKYALIYISEVYDKLKSHLAQYKVGGNQNIPYVKDDLLNVRSLVELLDIKKENVFEMIDAKRDELNEQMR